VLIEAATGNIVRRWELPKGFADLCTFNSANQLILVRAEGEPGKRVIQIRDLLAKTEATPIASITDFSRHIFNAALGPQAKYLLVEGIGGPGGDVRMVRVYDLAGKLVRALPTTVEANFGIATLDEKGESVSVLTEFAASGAHRASVFELPSGAAKHALQNAPNCLAVDANLFAAAGGHQSMEHGLSLYDLGSSNPLVTFDVIHEAPPVSVFCADGSLLAWGRRDGTLCIANLPEVKERLGQIGLGW
jgi:hypothetical protein